MLYSVQRPQIILTPIKCLGFSSTKQLCAIFLLLWLFCPRGEVFADQSGPEDRIYKVQAAYLYQFTKFIEWGDDAFISSEAPFKLCVYGKNGFADYLDPLKSRNSKGRSFIVEIISSTTSIKGCHLLYVERSAKDEFFSSPYILNTKNTLTISAINDFEQYGGVIGFVVSQDKVRLKINLSAAKRANLTISAKLLEVALNVYEDNEKAEK